MKTAIYLVAAALALGGCTTSKTIIGQDGKPAHSIACNGGVQTMSDCYEKAGELCGAAGYDVVAQDGSSRPFAIATSTSFSAGAAVYRSLTVRCRG